MTLREADLRQFQGGDGQYASGLFHKVIVSEGVHYVREAGNAYWLIDAICAHMPKVLEHHDQRLQDFQVWTLKVNPDKSAALTCIADSDEEPVVTQKLEYTDFPLPEVKFYACRSGWLSKRHGEVTGMKLMLPSEY